MKNRIGIRHIFAQHVRNQTSGPRSFNPAILDKPRLGFSQIRKRREERKSNCEIKLEQLLQNSIVTESLSAVSLLWKIWTDNISNTTVVDVDHLKLYQERVLTRLASLGDWSNVIGKYGTNWIKIFCITSLEPSIKF